MSRDPSLIHARKRPRGGLLVSLAPISEDCYLHNDVHERANRPSLRNRPSQDDGHDKNE